MLVLEHTQILKILSKKSIINILNARDVHKKSEFLKDMARLKSDVLNVIQNLFEEVNLCYNDSGDWTLLSQGVKHVWLCSYQQT